VVQAVVCADARKLRKIAKSNTKRARQLKMAENRRRKFYGWGLEDQGPLSVLGLIVNNLF